MAHISDIRHMVARSAYAQLGYSPLLLAGTLLGLVHGLSRAGDDGAVRLGHRRRWPAGSPGSSWR